MESEGPVGTDGTYLQGPSGGRIFDFHWKPVQESPWMGLPSASSQELT